MRRPPVLWLGLALLALAPALAPTASLAETLGARAESPAAHASEGIDLDATRGLERDCGAAFDCSRRLLTAQEGLGLAPVAEIAPLAPLAPLAQEVDRDATPRTGDVATETRPFERLRLYSANRRFSLGVSAIVYDVGGGASLRVLHGIALTAGYRVLGHDYDGGVARLQKETGGPLFGLAFDF